MKVLNLKAIIDQKGAAAVIPSLVMKFSSNFTETGECWWPGVRLSEPQVRCGGAGWGGFSLRFPESHLIKMTRR